MRTTAPVLTLGNAEPAFLLDEVEEHDLAHELFREIGGPNFLPRKFISNRAVFRREFFERFLNFAEQLRVFLEELFSDSFDAEGFFELCERRIFVGILKEIEKA